MGKPFLEPTGADTYVIAYGPDADCHDFIDALAVSRRQESERDFEGACGTRLESLQLLIDIIPDEGEITLEWDDANSQAAIVTGYWSGIDHFLIGDWEMAAAIFEMVLEVDPEDHMEATVPLAYTYVALEEYDSLDEVINDVNDKFADKVILNLWSGFRRTGKIHEGELIRLRSRFAPWYAEFTGAEHPADEKYLADISGENPSREALARELWLQTEHLWTLFPDFVAALKKA